MNNKKQYIIISVIMIIVLSFVAWRYVKQQNTAPPAHIVIVVDRSNSTTSRCLSLNGLVKNSFTLKNIKKGSSITILGTGEPQTAFEPVFIESFKIPNSNKILEGKGKVEKTKNELLTKVNHDCQSIKTTNHSPVLLAVKRGVEQLQSLGCQPDSNCQLFVVSDGQETENLWLKKAIRNSKPINLSIQDKVDNKEIKVVFCGLSEIKDKRNQRTSGKTTRINKAWKQMFTTPDKLVFQPFCPKYHLPSTKVVEK